MTCIYKNVAYDTGAKSCQGLGKEYECQADGTWKYTGNLCENAIAIILLAILLFVVVATITYKVGKYSSKKIGWD